MKTPGHNSSPTPSDKSSYDAEYRRKRKDRKRELIELHHRVVAEENARNPKTPFEIGLKSRRLLRNGKVETLPPEYGRIFKAFEEFITNPNRFPSLNAWGGEAINNVQSRTLIAKGLACMLPNTDLIGGRVGLPTEAGLKPISYDQLQEEYALRFGEYISPKSFAKVMKYLQRAGYYHSERINVCVDQDEGTIRSAPSYKQFTIRFFNDLKVVRYANISELILATRKRQTKKGLNFHWLSFRKIASGIQEIFNASTLNTYAQATSAFFSEYQPDLAPS